MANNRSSEPSFISFHPGFADLVDEHSHIELLVDSRSTADSNVVSTSAEETSLVFNTRQNFHEACIYHAPTKSVFVTSNQLPNNTLPKQSRIIHADSGVDKHVKLWRIYDPSTRQSGTSRIQLVTFPGWEGSLLNGGVNFGQDEILMCAQGSKNHRDHQGLVAVSVPEHDEQPTAARTILDNFHGIPFNSVNDVIVHPEDNSIWFTDPCYGAGQDIRPKPQLPNQLYRFNPVSGAVRALADGFTRCNGLCFSPDLKTLYVTDTGAIHGSPDVPFDPTAPSHIYAFDVADYQNEPFLTNRRLFAFAPGRLPDGIKCDMEGNVYSGCGDGVEVWNPQGVLIGTIKIDGGVANFCFGEGGVMYACNETKFWKIYLRDKVRGALLGL